MADLNDGKTRSSREAIQKIAKRLNTEAAIAECAALRRLDWEAPDRPAFWQIVVRDLEHVIGPEVEEEGRWAAILAGLAEVAGSGFHRPGVRLGEAAAAAEIHEQRVMRLLRAHGDALLDLIHPLARQLVARGQFVDWTDVAELVLSDGQPDREEAIRHKIARHYFAALSKKTRSTEEKSP